MLILWRCCGQSLSSLPRGNDGNQISLLSRDNPEAVQNAIYALARIAQSSNVGARAVVAAGVLDLLDQLLESPEAAIRQSTRQLRMQISRSM